MKSAMAFFGFDATLPRDRGHPTNAPGFGQVQDPFASLSRGRALEDDDDDGYANQCTSCEKLADRGWINQY